MLRNLALILVSFSTPLASGKVVEKIVASVNDQIVLQSDLERYKKNLSSGGFVDEALLQIADKSRLLKDRQALIDHMIDEKIMDYEVKKRNLGITLERVEQEIRSITSRRQINRSQLKQLLLEKGVTFSDYQDFIRSSIERNSLIEKEITSKIKISDEDVAAFYLSKKGPSKAQAFEYSLAHILFLPSNGGLSAAKDRAEKVLGKIRDGVAFEKLAEQYSEDPSFAQGGLLGNFKTGEMNKQIEGAVQSLDAGQTSHVVETRAGVHIFRVLRKSLTSDPELTEKMEEYRAHLFNEAFKRQFRSWLDQRRQEAAVRIN